MNKVLTIASILLISGFTSYSQSSIKIRIDSFNTAIQKLETIDKLNALMEMSELCISDTIEAAAKYVNDVKKLILITSAAYIETENSISSINN